MAELDFDRLFDEHAQALFGFLAYRTGDRVLAEDLLSETFERVLRSKRRFDPRKGSEKTWLYAIALNQLRDHQRRSDAESRAVERAEGRDAQGEAQAMEDAVLARDSVSRALATLSEEERESIALRFGGDLTVPEIAKLTGEPLTTVEGRVYRALRKLKQAMDG